VSAVAIIGGTGLYRLDGLEISERRVVPTPFGDPSAPLVLGRFGAHDVVFLPRHGTRHSLTPSEVNYRANIWALKHVGARLLISVSAVGSLRDDLRPGDFVLPTQYIDMAHGQRHKSFFGAGVVAHVSTASVANPGLAVALATAATRAGARIHAGGTYVGVEGPRLGTRAESFMFRTMGADVVGMTQVPEAFLAKEAQLSAATLAIVTDYDCWREGSEDVTVESVMRQYGQSVETVRATLTDLLSTPFDPPRDMHLAGAIMTPRASWPAERVAAIDTLLL